jgi:hypothetical protein
LRGEGAREATRREEDREYKLVLLVIGKEKELFLNLIDSKINVLGICPFLPNA